MASWLVCSSSEAAVSLVNLLPPGDLASGSILKMLLIFSVWLEMFLFKFGALHLLRLCFLVTAALVLVKCY